MTPPFRRSDTGLGGSFLVSLLAHFSIYGVVAWFHFFPPLRVTEAPVYYVDMVNLPVAEPQAGLPAVPQGTPASATPPAPAKPSPEMKLPAKPTNRPIPVVKTKPVAPQSAAESSRDFEERLAHLEKTSEARHEAAALDALRKKTASRGGQAGIPGGTGRESGSDYASYIRSRLVDAFKTTIAFQEKNPKVVIVIIIDRNGRVVKTRIERSSGDRLFEDSVNRAIVRAEKEFRPPPGGGTFEYGFIFSPQGVGKQ